jgi:hypothetical protein
LTSKPSFTAVCKEISAVADGEPFSRSQTEAKWSLATLNGDHAPTLILATPADPEQAMFVSNNSMPGIYKVGFWVGSDEKEGRITTPFGKIVWVPHA